jgi:hypothetical protein
MMTTRYCKDCTYSEYRQTSDGIDVKCTNKLVPESWRDKWVYSTEAMATKSPMKCPNPNKWFKAKEEK